MSYRGIKVETFKKTNNKVAELNAISIIALKVNGLYASIKGEDNGRMGF